MKFRPCIDIHNGKVKQIVGGSLTDTGDWAQTNFVAERPAQWFASRYREDGLTGGHVILLNPPASRYFAKTRLFKSRSKPCDCNLLCVCGRSDPLGESGEA